MAQAQRYCHNCGTVSPPDTLSCPRCAASLKITIPLPQNDDDVVAASAAKGEPPSIIAHLRPDQRLQGRYRILKQVGMGGFGAVYKAIDTQRNNHPVAVKEIGLNSLTPQQVIEATDAFNREVMLLTELKHRSIPRVYAHLTDTEHWYVVMDFIEGETLEQYRLKAPGSALPLERVLSLGIQLCEVLDYLHNHQPPIIFRDVKPSNIMLTPAGDLYLIDFGVARYFQPGKTRDTIAFGSPGFAAPEQYGKAQTTPQSDIYSLGVTLYQLLTGVDPSLTPFRFLPLRVLDATTPPELDTLVMHMLEMEMSKRPTSMTHVKQELQRIAGKQRADKAANLPAALPSKTQGKQAISFSTQGLTRYIYRGHSAFVCAVAWSPDGTHIASASEDWTVQVWEALSGKDRFTYHNHSSAVSTVAWSPNGIHIASGSRDQTVQVWDAVSKPYWFRSIALRSGFLHFTYEGHASGIQTVAWSPDGQYIASSSIDHSVRIWDVSTSKVHSIFRDPGHVVHALSWSLGGRYLALGNSDRTVLVWDRQNHHTAFSYKGHTGKIRAVAWSPDGQSLASAGMDGEVHVWQAV